MAAPRVLVGCFALEVDTFAPGETTLDDFRAQTLAVGPAIHREVLGPESELAAAWAVLEAAGCTIVPSVVAWSAPGLPLALPALQEIVRLAVAACDERIDGVYFMLHGACAAHGDDDPEGTLLAALRARLGPGRPISVSLDCHANLTPRMVEAADAIAAYRTCPHTDMVRTGAQAARILVDALQGRARPVCALAGRPMITPADLHDSSRDPFRRLMGLCDRAEQEGALAAALLPVQPWLDLPGLGWKAVVTTDGDRALAARLAERIVEAAWQERHAFLGGRRLPIDEALAEALRGPAPFVIADAGDTPNGGALGDSTELLRAALRLERPARVLLSVLDPDAAAAAHRAGVGATITTTLGSGPPGAYNQRVEVTARVERLYDGEVRYTLPVNKGYRAATGPAALLAIGPMRVVVHTRRVNVVDPALYEALGADPRQFEVVQAKSHVSYRAGFAPITERSVVADTDGPTTANLHRLPYRRRPRPLFPFEDI